MYNTTKILALAFALLCSAQSWATPSALSKGQRLYVPVFSEIPYGEGKHSLPLTATLSVRNIDPSHPLNITAIRYYDSKGKLLTEYLSSARMLAPLESVEYVVKQSDRRGGISASFQVEWSADQAVHPPIVQTVMIGATSGQGISFSEDGRVIQ